MATHDFATVDAMRKRVIRLDDGVLIADVEAGNYTTGSIPRVEVDDRPIPARVEEPAVADGYDDGALPPVEPDVEPPTKPDVEAVGHADGQSRPQDDPTAYGGVEAPEGERQAAAQGSGR
jgi:cell division transport system ATP-binding protein